MSTCICGNKADSFGGMCDRCVALQSLGLYSTASQEQIEDAYHTLVKVWHPDRFGSDPKLRLAAEEKLKEINSAHDYLVAEPVEKKEEVPYWRKRVEEPQAPPPDRPPQMVFQADPDLEESEEVRRILRRQTKSAAPKILLKIGLLLGSLTALVILWFVLDGFMSTNQHTSADWLYMKAQITRDLVELHLKSENLPGESANSQSQAPSAPTPAQNSAQPSATPTPEDKPRTVPEHGKATDPRPSGSANTALPYVTAGLTPMEVLAVLGKPDSSSGEKMFYKGSEIDFRDGHVSGWKVDPAKSALRVKLWPNAAPTPGLTAFNVGSSKNDVIALQGTPTLFTDNEFGYGSSVVFFQSNRVVGWKQDPRSVRLKVAR